MEEVGTCVQEALIHDSGRARAARWTTEPVKVFMSGREVRQRGVFWMEADLAQVKMATWNPPADQEPGRDMAPAGEADQEAEQMSAFQTAVALEVR